MIISDVVLYQREKIQLLGWRSFQYGAISEGVEQLETWLEFDTRGFIKY